MLQFLGQLFLLLSAQILCQLFWINRQIQATMECAPADVICCSAGRGHNSHCVVQLSVIPHYCYEGVDNVRLSGAATTYNRRSERSVCWIIRKELYYCFQRTNDNDLLLRVQVIDAVV